MTDADDVEIIPLAWLIMFSLTVHPRACDHDTRACNFGELKVLFNGYRMKGRVRIVRFAAYVNVEVGFFL